MRKALTDGIVWFRRELTHLVPQRVRAMFLQPPRVLLLLVGKAELELVLYRSTLWGREPRRTSLGSGNWQDLEGLLRGQLRSWGWISNVELAVPIERCLVLEKNIPSSAINRSGEIIKLDLQRSNPGGLDDIEFGHVLNAGDPNSGQVRATCYVCKRSIISAVLERVASIDAVASAVRVVDDRGRVLAANLNPARPNKPPLVRALRSASWMLGATLIGLAVFSVAVHKLRAEAEISDVEAFVEELRVKAKAQRQALSSAAQINDGIASLRLRRLETPTTLEIWEELTKVLPGSAWVVEVRLEDSTVSIDGSARSASELVALLSKSSVFRSVEFAAPVTRDAQRQTERFQLRAKLALGASRR